MLKRKNSEALSKAQQTGASADTNDRIVKDVWVYRLGVISLGLCANTVVIFAMMPDLVQFLMHFPVTTSAHAATDATPMAVIKTPEGLLTLGSAAIGALAGMLTLSPGRHN